MDKIIKKTELKYLAAIVAVFAIGIFLRTYNFHDWLRFNPDQARDAGVVSDAISGKSSLPLLGPKAGGTEFKLGPAFYYLQFASAEIFGNQPDKMAYPDLITSILTIPLTFFFLRLYFSKNIALGLVLLEAVSLFAVRFGRFAWNPNSMPFWTLLYVFAMLKIFNPENKKRHIWSIIAGIALGIAAQLHTLLLVILPIHLLIVFGWGIYKKISWKKYFIAIILSALILNIPQIISEIQTGGKNMQAFFAAKDSKTKRNNTIFDAVKTASACTMQANIHIVSGLGSKDECDFFKINLKNKRNFIMSFIEISLGIILSLGGLVFFAKNMRKEREFDRMAFLIFSGIFAILYFGILITVAQDISMRFYLGMIFIPFILLGFWMEFLLQVLKKYGKMIMISLLILFAILNLSAVKNYFASFNPESKNNLDIITLGEAEGIAGFIASHSNPEDKIMLDGNSKIMFRLFRPVRYMAEIKGRSIEEFSNKNNKDIGKKLFVAQVGSGDKLSDGEKVGRFYISEK